MERWYTWALTELKTSNERKAQLIMFNVWHICSPKRTKQSLWVLGMHRLLWDTQKLVKQSETAQLEDTLHTRQDSQFPTRYAPLYILYEHYESIACIQSFLWPEWCSSMWGFVCAQIKVSTPMDLCTHHLLPLLVFFPTHTLSGRVLATLNFRLSVYLHARSETCRYQVQSRHLPHDLHGVPFDSPSSSRAQYLPSNIFAL